jgi:cobalamin transport system substrate-binding protein
VPATIAAAERPRRLAALLVAATISVTGTGCHARPAAAGRTVTDMLGRSLTVPEKPGRVVSLAPSVTESLLALGFGDRLAGVSDFCVLPEGLARIPRVGGLLTPDFETIRNLHPDLLIGTTSGNDPGLASQADALGLPLYILHTPDVAQALASLERLGDLLGEVPRARHLVEDLRRRLAAVASRVADRPPPRVLFVVWAEPLVVPGSGAFLTDAIRLAGGASVTADVPAPHPTYSIESAVSRAPDVILTTAENAAFAAALPKDPAWAGVPAVRNRRIHIVGAEVVRPGPGVVAGIEEMAAILHPAAGVAPDVSH